MSGFRARWRELLREGWKSKVPTGLSNDYTYLMPGKTKKDVRGVDFFVGEAELLAYLDRIALDTADTACANEQSSNAAASSSQDPAVSTNLARKLVMKTLRVRMSEADVSEENSPADAKKKSADTQREEAQSTAKYAGISRMMLDFAALYSEGEKKSSVYDNDEDLGLGEGDSAVEDAAADPDLHFEPSLLEAVGGVGALARGSVHKNVLTDIKFNRWSGPDTQTSFPYTEKPYDERSDA
ncbi:hypothetical protein GQ600_3711 [Phytophthora cactorum]|nr:hypothetical protein GQ600_3711 [Phytophthora cactorum]